MGTDLCRSASSKAAARQRAIATMRITRATLAVAGFARRVTRSASVPMGNRVQPSPAQRYSAQARRFDAH